MPGIDAMSWPAGEGAAGGGLAGVQWPIAACSGGQSGSVTTGVAGAAGWFMPGIADMSWPAWGSLGVGVGGVDPAGVQCPIAACSGGQSGVATGNVGLRAALLAGFAFGFTVRAAGFAFGLTLAGMAMPGMLE
jgi:hypothetical protein